MPGLPAAKVLNQKEPVGQTPLHLIQVCVYYFLRKQTLLYFLTSLTCPPQISIFKPDRRLEMNVLLISTVAEEADSRSNTSHIMKRPSKPPAT